MRNELRVGMVYVSGWPMGLPGMGFFDGSVNFCGLDEFEEVCYQAVGPHSEIAFPATGWRAGVGRFGG